MKLGEIAEDEDRLKLDIDLYCSECAKRVLGDIWVGYKFYTSSTFTDEIESFKKRYLCGICRDKHRVAKNASHTKM